MKMLEVETLSLLVPTPRSILSVQVEYVPGIKLNKSNAWIIVNERRTSISVSLLPRHKKRGYKIKTIR